MTQVKNRIFKITFLFLFFVAQNSFASPSRNLTIFTEPNLSLALTKISRLYSQKFNVIVSINFNSSADLINEIDFGEPADVFISAHPGWIESLRQKGLVDVYNVGYIASDKLVLATPRSNIAAIPELINKKVSLEKSLQILDEYKAVMILDNEGNSSGKFSKDHLQNLNLQNLRPFYKLTEDKTPILNLIKSHSYNYSLLLASQVKNDEDIVVLSSAKENNIFYQALVIAGDNMEIAREFLKFLKSDSAKSILKESGFSVN